MRRLMYALAALLALLLLTACAPPVSPGDAATGPASSQAPGVGEIPAQPGQAAAVVSPDAPACYAAVMTAEGPRLRFPPDTPTLLALACAEVPEGAAVTVTLVRGDAVGDPVPMQPGGDSPPLRAWTLEAAIPSEPGLWTYAFSVDGQRVAVVPVLVEM